MYYVCKYAGLAFTRYCVSLPLYIGRGEAWRVMEWEHHDAHGIAAMRTTENTHDFITQQQYAQAECSPKERKSQLE